MVEFFLFTTNADVQDGVVLGKDIQTWLIYTLVFLGVTLLSFLWVWWFDLLKDLKSGQTYKNPWD